MTIPAVGELAPDFTAEIDDGSMLTLSAMRGQAVQEDRVLRRALHERRVHRVAGEVALALLLLVLLAHARPDIGVDDVRPFHRFTRIACDRDLRVALRAREQVVGGLVPLGTCDRELEAQAIRGVDPGVRHVVAIADPRDLPSLV